MAILNPPNDGGARHDSMDETTMVAHQQVSKEATSTPEDQQDYCCTADGCNEVAPPSASDALQGSSLKQVQGTDEEGRDKEAASSMHTKGECDTIVNPLLSRSEKLCVRHQRMADEGANARLQKVRTSLCGSGRGRLCLKCVLLFRQWTAFVLVRMTYPML